MANDISYSRIDADSLERWKTVRDVVAGVQAVRKGDYLPYLNAADKSQENEERNDSYRKRAVFYAATGRTLQGLLGLAFKKDPRLSLPAKLQYLARNCDGVGSSIFQQSQLAVSSILQCGRFGLYVELSEADNAPIIKTYAGESIINWDYDADGLTMVVLQELVSVRKGYEYKKVVQYRELKLVEGLYSVKLWRENEKGELVPYGEEVFPALQGQTLKAIPFQFIGSEDNDPEIDGSPLYPLADLNIAHYRNSADYEDSVFIVGQPQPWISGLSEEWRDFLEKQKIYIGSRSPLLLPAGGAFGFSQPNANPMVKEAMDAKEVQMVALGAKLLDQNAAQVTATQSENDRETSTSVLSMCVANVNEAYQNVIALCAEYMRLSLSDTDRQSSFKINQEFSRISVDPQAITAVVGAWQQGVLPKHDLWDYFRTVGLVATERTNEQLDSEVSSEGPSLGSMNDNG